MPPIASDDAVGATARDRSNAFIAAIFLIAAACYANSLLNGFALDDVWIVAENPIVTNPGNLLSAWTRPYWPGEAGDVLGLYRPLPITLYNLQWALGGGAPWVFHAVNVLLHALVSVLVLQLGRRLAPLPYAAAGAAVFAVHPVHTEAVANVVGQAELLAALFGLLACIAVLKRDVWRPWLRIAVVTACYVAALASKEHALMLPALLALLLAAVPAAGVGGQAHVGARGWGRVLRDWLADWRLFGVLALVAVAYLGVRSQVLASALSVEAPWVPFETETATRLRTALRLWNEYARLLFFPVDLASDYSPAVILPSVETSLRVVTGGLLLGSVLTIALSLPRYPRAGLCAAWFLVSILPTSHLILLAPVVLAERALYLPSVALAWGIAVALPTVVRRLRAEGVRRSVRVVAAATAVIALVALGVRTWMRNPDWKSSRAVNDALLRDHPEAYKSQWYAAGLDFQRGDTAAARERFVLALRMEPNGSAIRLDYGEFLLRTGDVDSAIAVLEPATRQRYYSTGIDELLALAYLRSGLCDRALDQARLAEQRFLPTWRTRFVEVQALFGLGRVDAAATAARDMARAEGPVRAYRWLVAARVLQAAGRQAEADDARVRGRAAATDESALRTAESTAEAAFLRLSGISCRTP
ncbi:MAG TPA: tetratricopeptide repeat protein [Longimicrobiales bacterium]